MENLSSTQWQNMMEYLRNRHGSICRQWFGSLDPVSLDSGLLRIHTPDAVQCNYLQHKCRRQFTEAAQDVTGKLVTVRFQTGPFEQAPLDEQQPGGAKNSLVGTAADLPVNGSFSSDLSNGFGSQKVKNNGWLWEGDELHQDQMILSPDYNFDNFITGPNNQLAAAAAVAVANQPGVAYNPLFIHGGVGLGKTHLLQAICQQILSQKPGTRILYVSCESFTNQFIACVKSGKMNEFRHRYRNVDVLVIDDIHFLGNRERSQEEFFHTFNDMYQSQRQIVLSSDAAPTEIPHLEDRLLSRFQWGLVAMVSRPHYETRVAILRAKAELRQMNIPDDVIAYIATKIDSNARELEGAIITLQGHASLGGRPINMDLAREMMGDLTGEKAPSSQITLERIIEVVIGYYSVKLSDLQSKRRSRSITEPRQICMWLARKHSRFSLEEIGGYFGGRDHTTAMHAVKTVDDRMEKEEEFSERIALLDRRVQNLDAQ